MLRENAEVFQLNKISVEILCRKIALLHQKRVPTEYPLLRANVWRTKNIRFKMTGRADTGAINDAPVVELLSMTDLWRMRSYPDWKS